jgi:hemerythrin-like domain-containing protein
MDEHRGIERMLSAMEREAPRLEAGDGSVVAMFESGVDFLRNFADRCHHHKEEQLLFPALEARGVAREGGPIGVLLDDHVKGRAEIRAMDSAISRYRDGDATALRDLAAASRRYVDLLRQHILEEDEVLFVAADRLLSPEEKLRLVAEFDRVEEEVIGAGTHERYHRMLDSL